MGKAVGDFSSLLKMGIRLGLLCLLAVLASVSCLVVTRGAPALTRRLAAPLALSTPDVVSTPTVLLAEILDTSGERAYGAVDAPGWVLPVFAVLAVLTSLLPLLLAPGENALVKMREDEGNRFGTGKEMGNRKSRRM